MTDKETICRLRKMGDELIAAEWYQKREREASALLQLTVWASVLVFCAGCWWGCWNLVARWVR